MRLLAVCLLLALVAPDAQAASHQLLAKHGLERIGVAVRGTESCVGSAAGCCAGSSCPHANGVCCPQTQHCCPQGSTCSDTSVCYRTPEYTQKLAGPRKPGTMKPELVDSLGCSDSDGCKEDGKRFLVDQEPVSQGKVTYRNTRDTATVFANNQQAFGYGSSSSPSQGIASPSAGSSGAAAAGGAATGSPAAAAAADAGAGAGAANNNGAQADSTANGGNANADAAAGQASTPAPDSGAPGSVAEGEGGTVPRGPEPPKPDVNHWDYWKSGADWTGTCQSGAAQSPVNINSTDVQTFDLKTEIGRLLALDFNYLPTGNLTLKNDGHALSVKGDFGFVVVGERFKYMTRELRFHANSEHTIDASNVTDGHKAMELQIVHQQENSAGNLNMLIVSVLFELGDHDNEFLKTVEWKRMPEAAGGSHAINTSVDLTKLYPSLHGDFFAYDGSVTYPSCDEAVQWRVMRLNQVISVPQYMAIRNLFAGNRQFAGGRGNNRLTQPLNGRRITVITVGSGEQEGEQSTTVANGATSDHAPEAVVHFNYSHEGTDWTGKCHVGTQQSPININTNGVMQADEHGSNLNMEYKYKPLPNMKLKNNGHAVEVSGQFGAAFMGGREYDVKQFNFHAPSEHTVDGQHKPMEMHIVHQKKGSRGSFDHMIISVLFTVTESGEDSKFLSSIDWSSLPKTEGKEHVISAPVDLGLLKNTLSGDFYAYHGSFTAPPCDQTVDWRVMKTEEPVSVKQLKFITALFAGNSDFAAGFGNNRRVQPLNDRHVVLVSGGKGGMPNLKSSEALQVLERAKAAEQARVSQVQTAKKGDGGVRSKPNPAANAALIDRILAEEEGRPLTDFEMDDKDACGLMEPPVKFSAPALVYMEVKPDSVVPDMRLLSYTEGSDRQASMLRIGVAGMLQVYNGWAWKTIGPPDSIKPGRWTKIAVHFQAGNRVYAEINGEPQMAAEGVPFQLHKGKGLKWGAPFRKEFGLCFLGQLRNMFIARDLTAPTFKFTNRDPGSCGQRLPSAVTFGPPAVVELDINPDSIDDDYILLGHQSGSLEQGTTLRIGQAGSLELWEGRKWRELAPRNTIQPSHWTRIRVSFLAGDRAYAEINDKLFPELKEVKFDAQHSQGMRWGAPQVTEGRGPVGRCFIGQMREMKFSKELYFNSLERSTCGIQAENFAFGTPAIVALEILPVSTQKFTALFGHASGARTQQGSVRIGEWNSLQIWNGKAWTALTPAGALEPDKWNTVEVHFQPSRVAFAVVNGRDYKPVIDAGLDAKGIWWGRPLVGETEGNCFVGTMRGMTISRGARLKDDNPKTCGVVASKVAFGVPALVKFQFRSVRAIADERLLSHVVGDASQSTGLRIGPAGTIQVFNGGVWQRITSNAVIRPDTWHDVEVYFTAGDRVQAIVDGQSFKPVSGVKFDANTNEMFWGAPWIRKYGMCFQGDMRAMEIIQDPNSVYPQQLRLPGNLVADSPFAKSSLLRYGDICFMSGSSKRAGGTMLQSPASISADCRPPSRLIVESFDAQNRPTRYDITDTRMLYGGGYRPDTLDLDGIVYARAGAKLRPLTLASGWRNYGSGYFEAHYLRQDSFCVLHGLIRSSSRTGVVATLPLECTPNGRVPLSANSHQYSTRVDLYNNGHAKVLTSRRSVDWVSLSGMSFVVNTENAEAIKLRPGFVEFGEGFRAATCTRDGGIVGLAGTIRVNKEQTRSSLIATLPEQCRPAQKLRFHTNRDSSALTLTIDTNGRMEAPDGRNVAWLTLEGIMFSA